MPMTPEERAVVEAAVRLRDWSTEKPATYAGLMEALSTIEITVDALHAASGGRWKAEEK